MCPGGQTTLSVEQSGYTYAWSGPPGGISGASDENNRSHGILPGPYFVSVEKVKIVFGKRKNKRPMLHTFQSNFWHTNSQSELYKDTGTVQFSFTGGAGTVTASVDGGAPFTVTVSISAQKIHRLFTSVTVDLEDLPVAKARIYKYTAKPTINRFDKGQPDICGEATPTLTAVPSGGTPPYVSYKWSGAGGPQTGSSITINEPGSYRVHVTDSNGCTNNEASVTVNKILPQELLVAHAYPLVDQSH